MKIRTLIPIALFFFCTCTASGQLNDSNTNRPGFTNEQKLGKRVFEQRCAVCHTQVTAASPMYGIALYKDLVAGKEEMIRDYIRNGSKRMPGFKYGLESSEIDAIVEYLKTVPKRAPSAPQPKSESPLD